MMMCNLISGTLQTLIMVMVLLFSAPSTAADYYIAQSAAGTEDASSCANAKAYTWDWTAPNVAGDDTIWICGTIANSLSIPVSGIEEDHPITVKFCTNAVCGAGTQGKFSSEALNGIYISVNGRSNIVIDGVDKTLSIIENTNNGSELTYQYDTIGVGTPLSASATSNIEIKNLTIQNMYVHVYGSTTGKGQKAAGIFFNNGTNIKVHDVNIYHAGHGSNMTLTYPVEFYDNVVKNCCHGAQVQGWLAGTTISDVKIHDNEIEMGANWMSGDGYDDCHLNGSYQYATQGNPGGYDNFQFYNNYIHGPFENPGGDWIATGFLHYDYGRMTNSVVFNNLFVGGPYFTFASNGWVSFDDIDYYNNTFISNGRSAYGLMVICASGSYMYNNLAINHNNGTYASMIWTVYTDAVPSVVNSDFNLSYNHYPKCFGIHYVYIAETWWADDSDCTLNQWSAYLAGEHGGSCSGTKPNRTPADSDCNSYDTDPDLDSSYVPKAGSPAIGTGKNLTTLCTTYPALCYDRAGNARPSSSAWDIGAYEYVPVGQVTGSFGGNLR